MSAKPLRPYSEVELVPGQPGQTPLIVSYSLSVGDLPALRQKRGVGSREEAPHAPQTACQKPPFTAKLTNTVSVHFLSQLS